jgi:Tfp pilus assembly protein PilP
MQIARVVHISQTQMQGFRRNAKSKFERLHRILDGSHKEYEEVKQRTPRAQHVSQFITKERLHSVPLMMLPLEMWVWKLHATRSF